MACCLGIRRYLALLAAYAVALQALFSAFAVPPVAHAAADSIFVICQADAADTGGLPGHPPPHDPCLACLAGHCAGAAANDDRIATIVAWPAASRPAGVPFRFAALDPFAPRERLHAPRAPPAG